MAERALTPDLEKNAMKLALQMVPDLLMAHQSYLNQLMQGFSQATVVNTLRSLGFEVTGKTTNNFHTFKDFLKGVGQSEPPKDPPFTAASK